MPSKPTVNLWVSSPIDWWSGMIDLSKHSPREFAMDYGDALNFETEVHELLGRARKLAKRHGWEGDTVQGPFLSAIPNGDGDVDLIVAWKQSNNGTCFVASYAMLPDRGFDNMLPHQS